MGVFPLHRIAHVGVNVRGTLRYSAVKLFSKYSKLCEKSYLNVMGKQTMDGQTTFNLITIASRGKKSVERNKFHVYIDGRSVDVQYSNWSSGRPFSTSRYDCVAVKTLNNEWRPYRCVRSHKSVKYVCQSEY